MPYDERTEMGMVGETAGASPASAREPTASSQRVVDLTEGRTLRRLLEESGSLSWQDVAELGIQVAEGLDAEHTAGHARRLRITPETILCTRDGLGYVLAGETDDVLATSAAAAEYEAPEVWRNPEQVDARADQFSLGVVLYEALAGVGRRPFRVDFRRVSQTKGEGKASIEVSHSPQHDLRSLAPDAPERLVRIIERATRLSPSNRYDDCAQLAEALRGLLLPETEEASIPSAKGRRSWWLRAGVASIALVLCALIAYLVQPLVVGSRARQQMLEARQGAERLDAAHFASGLWRHAEAFQPSVAYDQRTRLYHAARDAAWRVRIGAVGELSKEAVDFEATAEESFRSAIAARTRAEQHWVDHDLVEATRSLRDAEEGFRNAVAARRLRWAAKIRQQLAAEVAKANENAAGIDLSKLRQQQASVEATISNSVASPDEFRRAESVVADIRHEVTAAMAEAGAVEQARKSADDAITAAEQAGRAAQPWAARFEPAKGPFDRGAAFLLSARDALDKDPSRALALADAAVARFQATQTAARDQVASQRQAAMAAQRRADRRNAKIVAASSYAAAERAIARAESATGATVESLQAQYDAYAAAKVKFEQAAKEALRPPAKSVATAPPVERAPAVAAVELPAVVPSPPTRAVPPTVPSAPLRAPTPAAVAAIPAAAPQPSVPMSASLARQIQGWMSQHCETVNRDLRATSDARARCEQLTVHDRRNLAQVRISYTFTLGQRSSSGIAWNAPTVREMLLDCSSSACRCIAGPDCS
jgi:hypothetical protein